MTRLFVQPEQIQEDRVTVTGADLKHIGSVLRMRPGEELTVSDGRGRAYFCRLLSIGQTEAELQILREEAPHELPSRLVLFQGLPKSDKLETIIQKAVELGASSVVPVAMKRSIVKWDEKKAENRVKRYQAIARSAAEQSGRDLIPEVTDCVSFGEAVRMAEALDHLLVPYESAEGIEESRATLFQIRPGQSAGIFIGPEGGFEESEIEALKAAGGKVLTLGKRILRTETAGPAVLSILMFHLEL